MNNRQLVWLSVHSSYSHSSLALPLLHAACESISTWSWSQMERTATCDPAEAAGALAAMKPDLVCATLYLFNRQSVLDILERLHVLNPTCLIAVGGPECLGDGANVLLEQYPFIRTVFRGEGEDVLPDYLEAFHVAIPRSIIPPAANAVSERWSHSSAYCKDPFFCKTKAFVQFETSRGCPMGCSYCTSCHTQVRFKSPDAVRTELNELRDAGIREIRLLDRTFNFPPERGAALLRLFREAYPEMRFHLEIHPQFLNDELRSELMNARQGQLHVEAGIQSLNDCVQQAVGRRSPRNQALEGLRFLCNCDAFETHVDLLSGLPKQTLESIFEDVSVLLRLGPAEIQLEVLKILPGTPLRQQADSLGIAYAKSTPYDVMRTPDMSCEDILQSRLLSRLIDLVCNHPALHPVMQTLCRNDEHVMKRLLVFFLEREFALDRLYDLKKRFLLLADFLRQHPDREAMFSLAYQWINAGFPPEETPFIRPERLRSFPEQATLRTGDPSVALDRESRFWLLRSTSETYCFAFNRRVRANLPAAIWIV